MIKSTLFLGRSTEDSLAILKQYLRDLPNYVHTVILEAHVDIDDSNTACKTELPQVVEELSVPPKEMEELMYDMLLKQPAVIVATDLHKYKDLQIPYDIPIYATMNAESKADALEMLSLNKVGIAFINYVHTDEPSV